MLVELYERQCCSFWLVVGFYLFIDLWSDADDHMAISFELSAISKLKVCFCSSSCFSWSSVSSPLLTIYFSILSVWKCILWIGGGTWAVAWNAVSICSAWFPSKLQDSRLIKLSYNVEWLYCQFQVDRDSKSVQKLISLATI